MSKRFLIALAIPLILAGCMSAGTKTTPEQIAQMHNGSTTYDQAIAILGEPNSIATLPDGRQVIVYRYTEAHANAAAFVPVVGLFAGQTHGTGNSLVLTFDQHGVLQTQQSSASQSQVSF